MRDKVMQGILAHIKPLNGFENVILEKIEPGFCSFSIEVSEDMLNLYGNMHGGVIFTLCDIAAGMSTYAYEVSNVTLQASINFVKAVNAGKVHVTCRTEHKGKSTAVNVVQMRNDKSELIATANMTMFITGAVKD